MTARHRFAARAIAPLLPCLLLAACAEYPPPPGANGCHRRDGMPQCPVHPVRALSKLTQGSVTATVDARCQWNETGIQLEHGASYRITAAKVVEGWADSWQPESDLKDGWPGIFALGGKLAQGRARATQLPMYSLIGAEGPGDGRFFVAGWNSVFTASRKAELLFFANDWPNRYHNNHGCLEVTIQRLP